MRSEDKGRTELFDCPQSPRLAGILNTQAEVGGAVGAAEREILIRFRSEEYLCSFMKVLPFPVL